MFPLRALVFLLPLAAPLPMYADAAPTPQFTQAQLVPAEVQALSDTLQIGPLMQVMRLEGIDYGATMEDDMFPGKGGAAWRATVARIYDVQTLRRQFDAALAREMGGDAVGIEAASAFFGASLGQRILTLETEARRSMLDEAVEEAAKVRVEEMSAKDDPRMILLRDFAEANGLIEANVAGALNANLSFFKGLAESEALGGEMTEEQMLSDVWAQEEAVRADTTEWLFAYLSLAYGPLSDEELVQYIEFSRSPAGKKLNSALFSAFDVVFTVVSGELGREAARQMLGEDI